MVDGIRHSGQDCIIRALELNPENALAWRDLGKCCDGGSPSIRKILAPIKKKIGTPPPPQNPKYPPLKRGILWTWLFLQNGHIFSRRP